MENILPEMTPVAMHQLRIFFALHPDRALCLRYWRNQGEPDVFSGLRVFITSTQTRALVSPLEDLEPGSLKDNLIAMACRRTANHEWIEWTFFPGGCLTCSEESMNWRWCPLLREEKETNLWV